MGWGTSPAEAWDIEKGSAMFSFNQAVDAQYESPGRYPTGELLDHIPGRPRPATQINLDVRRAQRSEALGR